jgi:hypothetical protein
VMGVGVGCGGLPGGGGQKQREIDPRPHYQ